MGYGPSLGGIQREDFMNWRFLRTLVAVVLVSSSAYAIDFGFRYGQINDADEDFIGVELLFPSGPWSFNPSFEYWLTDSDPFLGDLTVWTLNADFNYYFSRGATVNPYFGLGAAYSRLETDVFEDDEFLGNVNAGLDFRFFETVLPYIQGRYFRSFNDGGEDSDDLAFMIGLRF